MQRLNRRGLIKALGLSAAATVGNSAIAAGTEAAPSKPAEVWPAVDVLVCGGGPAGVGAALLAAKCGAKTLVVERYGRLGGMAVQAMVGPLMGDVTSAWVDFILERIGGRRVNYEFVDLAYTSLLEEAGADVLLHAAVVEPLVDGRRVAGARLWTKQGTIDIPAKITIDATGDGDLAFQAGAPFEQGRGAGPNWPADGLVQPMTIMFRVSGVDHAASMEANRGRKAYRFADGHTWNETTKAANARGDLPATVGMVRTYTSLRDDERVINATQINGVDGTNVRDLTRAELEGRRQVGPIMEFLKKHAPGFQKAYVSGVPAVIGVRETRRVVGQEYLTVDDVLQGTTSPRAVVHGASFPVDIHNPSGVGQAQGVSAAHPLGRDPAGQPYDIPYGCLVPRQVEGLLVAGRPISGSHEAMASYRVQVIAMATGVAAGAAAALAAKKGLQPRDMPVGPIQEVVFAKPS